MPGGTDRTPPALVSQVARFYVINRIAPFEWMEKR